MTRKEQIIEILDKYGLIDENYLEVANAILALPIEVPSEEEIIDITDDYGQKHCEDEQGRSIYGITTNAFRQGLRWAIKEIIRRNK